ncbi:tRNA uridine-5-carboxymethylaminomethyl(34) synthesis GTPase MnmE [Tumebacillus sp. ITR2]|uniref:tRNA modification GTPase MnmE n=1 Tax=Tumebacillus amylolyticus TaxID=2801339 RepID=A0ABS1J428_9BACL|nr:tRNA uridine-5-carboxymethylaminomethyl(34) synthesis GTPase MnmE [Tumebacillus amylolyticus]MBL0385026.1 tRNA uridine-5-carboxymethylaminomethyl(34) synthesis GTPase MnmE [Tumebacillus amylolyticus]
MKEFDTIAAIATALGEGSISVIRVSGTDAVSVVDKIYRGKKSLATVDSHTMNYGSIIDPQTGERVDEVFCAVFHAPRTYTGEEVVEIQGHGGIVAVQRVMRLVLNHGARLAEPGEFTKRAFLNGRIDLSQAEAVIDVIRSKTDAAMKVAFRQVEGGLSKKIKELRQKMVEMLAHIEVTIDYPEHDVEDVTIQHVITQGDSIVEEIHRLLGGATTGKILREGLKTVIIGKPNVGKSSLLNALSRTNRAIVTDIEGTTRDILEEHINLRGIPLNIIDTAGIRETEDIVERLGVERSREALEEADLVLFMIDASRPLNEIDRELAEAVKIRPTIVILNKTDLPRLADLEELRTLAGDFKIVETSVATGEGMEQLERAVEDLFLSGGIEGQESTYLSNARHVALLEKAGREMSEALDSARMGMTLDLVAVDVRSCWMSLGEVVGEAVADDLLDQIFSQFCLGK